MAIHLQSIDNHYQSIYNSFTTIYNRFTAINNPITTHLQPIYNQLQSITITTSVSLYQYHIIDNELQNHCQKVISIIHTGFIGIANKLLIIMQTTSEISAPDEFCMNQYF